MCKDVKSLESVLSPAQQETVLGQEAPMEIKNPLRQNEMQALPALLCRPTPRPTPSPGSLKTAKSLRRERRKTAMKR